MANTYLEQLSQAPPGVQVQQLISGYLLSQAIGVAADLGIADLLADGPKSSGELAEATGSHPRALYRLLRALAGVGIFTEVAPQTFGLTPMGETLRSDAPASLRARALHSCGDVQWRTWGQLGHSVRTGETAFKHVHGMENWQYQAQHPEANAMFNAFMTGASAQVAGAVVAAYDFSRFGTLVDVGGGLGQLLTTILAATTSLRGVLFDQPHVVADARSIPAGAGVADRCEIVGGSFFDSVPSGGDAYLLRSIIHDWDDDRSIAILSNCRRAMGPHGTLLLVEVVIPPGDTPSMGKLLDLEMLAVPGGQERTEEEYRALFEAAGFTLTQVVPTRAGASVIEGVPT